MLVEAVTDETGKIFSQEIPSVTSSVLEMIAELDFSDERIRDILDRLSISADAKSLLYAISKTTLRVGQTIVKIGRKIIDCIVRLIEEFPNAGLGIVIGGILGYLVSAIPVIGFLLGAVVTPLFAAIGFAGGAFLDVHDKLLARRITEMNRKFDAFSGK